MASLLFQATSITLLLLPFLTLSTSILFDTDNDPIINGGSYYIVPQGPGYNGGLTYTQKKDTCPLYITAEKSDSDSPGTPVRISSPLRILVLSEDMRVTLEFKGDTPCNDDESLVWKSTIDPLDWAEYITTGGDYADRSFSITKRDRSSKPTYELRYWPRDDELGSSKVGLHEHDGLLGLTYHSTTVSFKKAVNDVIELPSTS